MDQITFKTFGKLEICNGRRALANFPTRYTAELLGLLLSRPHRKYTRLSLIAVLWPECDEKRGRSRLSTELWRLKTVCKEVGLRPELAFHIAQEGIAYVPTPGIQTDIALFEEHLDRAAIVLDPTWCEQHLRQAVDLYQGEFCPGLYADWSLLERERLARQHLQALGQLMHCLMQRNAYEEAAEIGQQILAIDPLREEAHRAIMLCQTHLGRDAAAMQQFQLCAQYLQNELELLPLPETITLYEQIVQRRLRVAWKRPLPEAQFRHKVNEAYSRFLEAGQNLNDLLTGSDLFA